MTRSARMRFSEVSRIIQAVIERCNLTLLRICLGISRFLTGPRCVARSHSNPEISMESTLESLAIRAPVIALDLGEKRVGVAVSDALLISITRIGAIPRSNWKKLLQDVKDLVRRYDAQTMVIGLPLNLNGSDGEASLEARRVAMKFARSLPVPIYLQDERLSSMAAEHNLRQEGHDLEVKSGLIDSEAAAIILSDFLSPDQGRQLVSGT